MHRLNFDRGGIGQERANHEAGGFAQRMHAQQGVRRRMFQGYQTAKFVGRQYHA